MVGGALITLLNNADRVKAACLAQLVNVIGAIFTEPGGPAWRQTIFHPFKLVTQNAHGKVLQSKVSSGTYDTKTAGAISQVLASAVHDSERKKIALFVLNRDAADSVELSIDLRAFPEITKCDAVEIAGYDLLATNTGQKQDTVRPAANQDFSIRSDSVTAKLRPLSWNVLTLEHRAS